MADDRLAQGYTYTVLLIARDSAMVRGGRPVVWRDGPGGAERLAPISGSAVRQRTADKNGAWPCTGAGGCSCGPCRADGWRTVGTRGATPGCGEGRWAESARRFLVAAVCAPGRATSGNCCYPAAPPHSQPRVHPRHSPPLSGHIPRPACATVDMWICKRRSASASEFPNVSRVNKS